MNVRQSTALLWKRVAPFFKSPLEPVLHLSRVRLASLGVLFFMGHLLLWWAFEANSPRPYENLLLRLFAALGSLPLFFLDPDDVAEKSFTKLYVLLYMTIAGPLTFTWMYLMNGGTGLSVTGLCVVCLVMYAITDWRFATVMIAIAFSSGLLLPGFFPGGGGADATTQGVPRDHMFVLALTWMFGLLHGVTSAKHDQRRLQSTLNALGVMAHELRTPIASAGLLVEGLRSNGESARARGAGVKLDMLLRNMNQQIDTQIVNAQLLQLRPGEEQIPTRSLVQDAIDTFPYRFAGSRLCVVLAPGPDFKFAGTTRLFTQVIQNLLRNALFALMKHKGRLELGDITFKTAILDGRGIIEITDTGPGIPEHLRRSMFRPFVSTSGTHSSGLGLAFCLNTVRVNKGHLRLKSSDHTGTTFVIDMPNDLRAPEAVHRAERSA